MKTAISELIWFISDGNGEIDESVKVSEIWEKCKELLEKEKQQIIDSFDEGLNCNISGATGEEYYSILTDNVSPFVKKHFEKIQETLKKGNIQQ